MSISTAAALAPIGTKAWRNRLPHAAKQPLQHLGAFANAQIPCPPGREGDIHVMGGFRGVWFKDPDGNILSITERAPPAG